MTHVYPNCTLADHAVSVLVGNRVNQGIAYQLDERFLVEAHQHAVRAHGHRCVAGHVRYERLLAESISWPQLGQVDLAPPAAWRTGHVAVTLFDDVVVPARITLADDQLVCFRVDALHALEHTLDVLRRQVRKTLRLQHPNHPIRRLLAGNVGLFQVRRPGVEIGEPELALEFAALDAQYQRPGPRPYRVALRSRAVEGTLGRRLLGVQMPDKAPVPEKLDASFEEVVGVVVLTPLGVDDLSGGEREEHPLRQDGFLVCQRQPGDRRKCAYPRFLPGCM